MVAILEKYQHNVDFHQIVDFVEASHIRYALTINPTVYVSHIRQFWSTARTETTNEGTKILATVDGKLMTISELSIKRNLKLKDEEGISTLPDAELFENLALMGVNGPSFSRRTVSLFESMLVHQGEDEPASPLGDDSQGEACPTISGLEVGQDRANIIKTSTLPHNSTPRVTSFAADEGTQDLEITNLMARIKLLEDKDGGVAEPFGEDAIIKGRSLETREEPGIERSIEKESNDIEELVNVLSSLDVANILTSGVQVVSVPPAVEVSTIGIPTGSVMVPTTSPIFTTASVVTPYSRRKGKEKMVESDTPKKKKLQEQIDIARDPEIARIHAEEELHMLIDGLDRNNETIAKYLQEYEQFTADLSIREKINMINELVKYQDHYAKGMTLDEISEKFIPVWKQIEDFVPMASKEEGERFKRKRLRLDQDSAKKIKTPKEVSEENLKEMMQLVPVEEVYIEALQVKHPIIDWEIYSEGQRTYWKIIRLGGHTTTLVKETLSIRQATSDKEKELWVELKRLYEPDVKDQLWTRTQALMHDLVEWRLYDTCGVHYVLTRDQEIFMFVEKEYPLRKGLAIVMISNKLQASSPDKAFDSGNLIAKEASNLGEDCWE
uniref:Xylulose kinase-1 n=1 Tax=Tanacetum cinerariifolium TaxID=118510 RepID=A0A6L2JT53_TANCI|nr:hypothetical protein [Tanacetum cinerariifolium]